MRAFAFANALTSLRLYIQWPYPRHLHQQDSGYCWRNLAPLHQTQIVAVGDAGVPARLSNLK